MRQYLSFWLPFGYHKILNERYLEAWKMHDRAYGIYGHSQAPDRLAADLKLVRDLTLMGASRWLIWPTYVILRIFFGKYWQPTKKGALNNETM